MLVFLAARFRSQIIDSWISNVLSAPQVGYTPKSALQNKKFKKTKTFETFLKTPNLKT